MTVLGLDTSNYTTSAALLPTMGDAVAARGALLQVPQGALGLRQSEALFQHVKRLPALLEELMQGQTPPVAVGASTAPREAEGSYMPCFLAGESVGRSVAAALGVPFFPFSHQQGHLAAAALGAGREKLLDAPFLAWHLSGGTTELLHVTPMGAGCHAVRLGGSRDLSAGQLVDRAGRLLGLDFPAGRALDALSQQGQGENHFVVKTDGAEFSLSGVENQVAALHGAGQSPEDIARFVLLTLASVLTRVTAAALAQLPGLPVLFSGGVAGAALLRTALTARFDAIFAPPDYSADNAIGIAALARRALRERNPMLWTDA